MVISVCDSRLQLHVPCCYTQLNSEDCSTCSEQQSCRPRHRFATATGTTISPSKPRYSNVAYMLCILFSLGCAQQTGDIVPGGGFQMIPPFDAPSSTANQEPSPNPTPPNLLFIFTDQQRFDTIRKVQDDLEEFDGKLKIRTPNIDRLASSGAYFRTAYCQLPSCSPSRTTIRTGCTVERHGVEDNKIRDEHVYSRHRAIKNKIVNLETYDQLLVEERGYVAEVSFTR
jgi:hypothetical protein